MIVESYADRFLDEVDDAFGAALEDAAAYSADLPGSPSDLHAVRTGRLEGRIGSDRDYARAQELGAYMKPRPGRRGRGGRPAALKMRDGSFRAWTRLPAKRYLRKTGDRWGQFLLARLRTVAR